MKKETLILAFSLCLLVVHPLYSQNAPITTAQHIYNPVIGQSLTMPVTVTHFEDISSISLIFNYNPAVLTFQGFVPNAAFNNFTVNGTSTPGRVIISWYALYGITLPDNAHLVDLMFMNNGGTTSVTWDSGDEGSCEYAKYDNGAYTVLNDAPFSTYYRNGYISSPSAPLTWAPVITNATPGSIGIPIKVNSFNDIGAISLTLEYDPAVMTYQNTYSANPVLNANGGWFVGIQDAPAGKKVVKISWTKTVMVPPIPPVNLPDSSIIITLNFNYIAGTSLLSWIDDGESCEYADGNYIPLEDSPTGDYYLNGLVTSQHYAPQTVMPCMTGVVGQTVVFPVRVYGFTNIGAISLTMDYNPTVLTYQWTSSDVLPLGWSLDANGISGHYIFGAIGGPSLSLPDGSVLFNISFIYNGGNSLIIWDDNDPISCEYADGVTLAPLYDLPRESFYIDGCIGPAPVINGRTFLEGAYDVSSSAMTTHLNLQSLIPFNQPYNSLPWNYAGTEVLTTVPSNVTDWVLVQLRTTQASSSTISTRAGLLTSDGAVTDLDGISPLAFPGVLPGYYYMVIYHRNHMAVLSSTTYQVNPFSGIYDFSSGPSGNYGGASGIKLIDIALGRWGMLASDASNDQNIYINDYTDYWVPDFGLNPGYSRGDFNLDGKVYIDDFTDLWVPNFGLINGLP
ncbi:MAG: hypothetical protein IPH88_05795 [Bacteroidales bacterium]|nr:hypothetical protein [Bacteroidales bacterium]